MRAYLPTSPISSKQRDVERAIDLRAAEEAVLEVQLILVGRPDAAAVRAGHLVAAREELAERAVPKDTSK